MKSAVRQRTRIAPGEAAAQRRVSWHEGVVDKDQSSSTEAPDDLYLPWYFVLLYLAILVFMAGVSLHFLWRLPEPHPNGKLGANDFHALRARGHMEDLVALGVRHVGSPANEIHAKNLIIEKVEAIRASASDKVEVEISVQHPSGGFYLDFLGGLNHIYQNITNVVVRVSRKGSDRKHAFMVNAHYDSALGSPAASDDAVSCGTMLEVIRCLSSEPGPLLAEHAIIFLFNGAEETILQASHGFVMQHPWTKTIRAFLNLEAAGAGGKEIVFQTGPNHPWLARLYSETVPHPHASVIAQEVFQLGVIPSDTDFRIFRDFGHIPGIDTAYFINGYVYHTQYDIPSAIPDGSIQRAGENVLALLRAVADSPHLSNPTAGDMRGKIVFFDILGLMTVVYPERVAMVMNLVCALLVAVIFFRGINWSGAHNSAKPSPKLVLLSMAVMLASWVAALVLVVAMATLLMALGRSMTWFSEPLLIFPLYVVPTVLAIGEIHTQLVKRTSFSQSQLEKASLLSVHCLWAAVLVLLTCLRVCSAFIFFIIISSQLLFRSLLHDVLISQELKKNGVFGLRALAYVLCSAFAGGLPMMLRLQLDIGLVQLLVPLMGRSGAIVPPDVVVAVFIVVFVATSTPYMVSVLIYSTSRQFKRWGGALLLGISLVTMVIAASGLVHPYSVRNPDFPMPKRLFLEHTDRTFYGLDGSITAQDSQVYVYPMDYLGIEPIKEVSPLYRNLETVKCEGLFCGEPLYIPIRHLLHAWFTPAPPLVGREAAHLKLLSSEKTSENSKNLTFQAHFPLRCTAVVGAGEGVVLKAWSLESFIPPINSCPGSHADRGCYFIFHARGFGDGDFTFWIETEGNMDASELLRIAVTTHYLDPPESQTAELSKLANDLPEWVSAISWTAMYREWVF